MPQSSELSDMSGENEKIWYIFDGGAVTGPFMRREVQQLVNGGQNSRGMIWQSGHTEWQPIHSWMRSQAAWNNTWYISSNGFNSGPYPIEDLCKKILSKELPIDLKLWTLGLKRWVGVYDVGDVTRALGIPPRKHRRVPIVAQVKIKGFLKSQDVIAQTLSVGGLGLTGLNRVSSGTKVNVTIISELLQGPVKSKAMVVYQHSVKGSSVAGLEFVELTPEAEKIVSEYVRQFEIPRLEAVDYEGVIA